MRIDRGAGIEVQLSPDEMTPKEEKTLRQAAETIADILYNNTPKEQVRDFEGIELALRDHWLTTVGPELAQKFCQQHGNNERA